MIYNMDMPYTTPMALGMALGWPERKVISIEGDGSMLAGPGVLSTIAVMRPKNLLMFIFDNGADLTTGSVKLRRQRCSVPTSNSWHGGGHGKLPNCE